MTYTQPSGTYGAQWTMDFVTWNNIVDTGRGSTHTFTVNTTGLDKVFFRHRIVIAP